jgi:hypothetical protein
VSVGGLRDSIAMMPKKKKLKRFSATSVVKAAARAVLGTPPPVKRAENKKHAKKDKHKPSLDKLLADADQG